MQEIYNSLKLLDNQTSKQSEEQKIKSETFL
jgi:hypothetical protein